MGMTSQGSTDAARSWCLPGRVCWVFIKDSLCNGYCFIIWWRNVPKGKCSVIISQTLLKTSALKKEISTKGSAQYTQKNCTEVNCFGQVSWPQPYVPYQHGQRQICFMCHQCDEFFPLISECLYVFVVSSCCDRIVISQGALPGSGCVYYLLANISMLAQQTKMVNV